MPRKGADRRCLPGGAHADGGSGAGPRFPGRIARGTARRRWDSAAAARRGAGDAERGPPVGSPGATGAPVRLTAAPRRRRPVGARSGPGGTMGRFRGRPRVSIFHRAPSGLGGRQRGDVDGCRLHDSPDHRSQGAFSGLQTALRGPRARRADRREFLSRALPEAGRAPRVRLRAAAAARAALRGASTSESAREPRAAVERAVSARELEDPGVDRAGTQSALFGRAGTLRPDRLPDRSGERRRVPGNRRG